MDNQIDDYLESSSGAGDQHHQHHAKNTTSQSVPLLTVDDVDAIAREIDDLPRVEKFDAKAQLARLGPALASMQTKGYSLTEIRTWLAARSVHASISSISRAISGGVVGKPKRKKAKVK